MDPVALAKLGLDRLEVGVNLTSMFCAHVSVRPGKQTL